MAECLKGSSCGIREVILSNIAMTDTGADAIWQALANNQSLLEIQW
jgi:hypothetical protein